MLIRIWIGFDNFVLNFFGTSGSDLGLQITAFYLVSLILWSFARPSGLCIVFV